MSQTDAYPLNETQLELVFNLPYYAALYLFKEPITPSEAARRLQVPANVMHYRVKRLLEAGLLEVADDSNRSRTYKTVAERFSLSFTRVTACFGRGHTYNARHHAEQASPQLFKKYRDRSN